MKTSSVGIDFGTSNSTCAVFDGTGAHLVPLEDGKPTLPSAIFFAEDGQALYGRRGISAYIDGDEGRLMRGLKSVLGTSLMSEKTIINKRLTKFTDILASFIGHLKHEAETQLGDIIDNVVMGRPVHFHDDNPAADLEAEQTLEAVALGVGFKGVQFQYEPIAAALAHERHLNRETLALVIDLGGGTSDFAVIRLSPTRSLYEDRRKDILATSGVRVGGTNFDTSLSMASFMPWLGLKSSYRSPFEATKHLRMPARPYVDLSTWSRVNLAQTANAGRETEMLLRQAIEPEKVARLLRLQSEKLGHAFLQRVEQAKIDLTDHAQVESSLSGLRFDFEVQVTREDFENAIANQVLKIDASIDECLRRSAVDAASIELIILTGGSSELPVINHLIQQKFPNTRVSKDDKFGSVGLGLAYCAEQIFSPSLA